MAGVRRAARRRGTARGAGAVRDVLLVGGLLAGGLALAPPAAAHSTLRASLPSAGAVLAAQPEAVELQFDGPVEQAYAVVTVVGPDGAAREQGGPRVDGARVTQAVGALDLPGRYRVSYRLASAGDEHPVIGSVQFEVAAGATARPAGLLAASPAVSGADGVPGPRVAALGAVAMLLLAAVALRSRRPRAP